MIRRLTWTFILLGAFGMPGASATAEEIGFLEDFSLATDRTAALELLIPGSEDYYYFHCLHYQNTEQFDQVERLLQEWIKRYRYTPQVREIQHRQALLTYPQTPVRSLEYLKQQLELRFDHRRESGEDSAALDTRLDAELIGRDRLYAEALRRYRNLDGFEDRALGWLLDRELTTERRRHLLERLERPDHPRLVEVIAVDLKDAYSKPFGSMPLHHRLLREQLDELVRLVPELRGQTDFVQIYLAKLQPNNDVDWRNNASAREEYLQRLWDFVQTLPPSHNSLKAHVLYQRLLHDRSQGTYDKERFLSYLQLPRKVAYIEPRFLEQPAHRNHPADLNQDFSTYTLLPPVGHDEPLVSSYLQHFFRTETSIEPYAPYIADEYLRQLLAETKIVHGLGEAEQWFSWLPPARYQQLKERIDLDFAFTNPTMFAPGEPVALELDIKNVRTLIVKVFEINTTNYYRREAQEVNTSVNLDGLVPNFEHTFHYDEPPLRRVRRRFEFPELKDRGVYVIDFIGNGLSSRAVVRKGHLRHHVREGIAGHVFTVLNDDNLPVPGALLWLAGHEYLADEEGQVAVPFTSEPGRQPIVLTDGDFSSLAFFQHASEKYELVAGIYVDRESLLERRATQVIVSPTLLINGQRASLSLLEDIRLEIVSTSLDGIMSSQQVDDFALSEDRASVHDFLTPPRVQSITITLRAAAERATDGDRVELAASETFTLNQIDLTDQTEDAHLSRGDTGFVLQLLGKSGEPRADRPVTLELKHFDFRDAVHVNLQTDAAGRIALGTLAGIDRLSATPAGGQTRSWPLWEDRAVYPSALHAGTDDVVRLPYVGHRDQPRRDEFSLLEVRRGSFTADAFESLAIAGGMLELRNLTPGDYDLLLKPFGDHIRIRVSSGLRQARHVLGRDRHLELRRDQPLQIADIRSEDDQLRIQLTNSSSFSRVHIVATRFEPAYSIFQHLARGRSIPPDHHLVPKAISQYVAGREIGDEYQYIINRKYARKFPGIMLDRPELLLNPWAVRDTETSRQQAQPGDKFADQQRAFAPPAAEAPAEAAGYIAAEQGSNLDFLPQSSVVLPNLQPDERGVVIVPRDVLGPHQHVHIVAVDPQSTIYRQWVYPGIEAEHRDLRLVHGFDPRTHVTQQKQLSVLAAGETVVFDNLSTARFELYDSLTRVYNLYLTLNKDPKLSEFGFVVRWPELPADEKRSLYSKFASHELHFFLARKDPEFFQTVVKPYLANKKHKTFLDLWLLEEDLSAFLLPEAYSRLNIAEQILLSRRIDKDRSHTRQDVLDRYAILPPDNDRFNLLFQTAIQGSVLDAGNELQVMLGVTSNFETLLTDNFAAGGMMGGMGGEAGGERLKRELLEENEALSLSKREGGAALGRFGFFAQDEQRLGELLQFYQQLDKTKEWAENNYYHLPLESQNHQLITVNRFWRDWAEHDGQTPFLSPHFAEASGNLSEMMLALALLDLPFQASQHEREYAEAKITLTIGSPAVLFHEDIREASDSAELTPILVSQNFYRQGERYQMQGNQRVDNFVSDEFLVHTVYGCQVAVTNPSSSPQKLDVLIQIPRGAIPVLNSHKTKSVRVQLEPYNTTTLEYHFYFPEAGEFAHYPVHVSREGELLAAAEPVELHVVEQLSRIDRRSWAFISQQGTDEDVLQFLREQNLHTVDLSRIAFRMRERAFYLAVTELLTRRHLYDHTLWSYSVYHDHPPTVRQYLAHSGDFVAQSGMALDSPLLTIDPVDRHTYQHLEYRPLVNARTHQLGRRRQILNSRLHQQYHALLKLLSYKRQLDSEQQLAVTYYLLLQDRIAEALTTFSNVVASDLETRLQYDYFDAYLAFYREEPAAVEPIAARYLDYPVDRWRNAFAAMRQQLRELEGGQIEVIDPESRDQRQNQLAADEGDFEFGVESRRIELRYQNLDAVRVNYYLMDLELLFSRNPFAQQFSEQFSSIRPNKSTTLELPSDQASLEFPLPDELRSSNILVEITGGGKTRSQTYYANALSVYVNENYGRLQVASDDAPRRPLAKVYVKVYAELQDGSARFYKDGYTDLRGRFDYSSLSTNELDHVRRFSLLILSDEHGAMVREARPPKQ